MRKEHLCELNHADRIKVCAWYYDSYTGNESLWEKHTYRYCLQPQDFFAAFDVPLLQYVTEEKAVVGTHSFRESETDIPELYRFVFDGGKRMELARAFGVEYERKSIEDPARVDVMKPYLYGRLEAVRRYTATKNEPTRVHMQLYHERMQSECPLQDYGADDAWYLEMLSGFFLTMKLAETLYALEKIEHTVSCQDNAVAWRSCWIDVLADTLCAVKDELITCPAIFWRAAALQRVIRRVDSDCRKTDGYLKKDEWEQYAMDRFKLYMWYKVCSINMVGRDDGLRDIDDSFAINRGHLPTEDSFWKEASDLKDCHWLCDRPTLLILMDATVAQLPDFISGYEPFRKNESCHQQPR